MRAEGKGLICGYFSERGIYTDDERAREKRGG
jgi:hypothetical protein